MMKWVLLACLASMAGAVSPVAPAPELEEIPLDISKYAIFLSESKAEETTTFTLKQTVITITKHAAAESSSLAVSNKKRLPKLIVKDAAAKGLVCVAAGQVEVTSAGQVVEAGESSASAAAAAAGAAAEEGGKAEELILVGQGDGVVASVSAAASAAAGGGAASSAASGGGAASSAAAGGGGAASSAAGGGGAASSAAAGEGSAASSAAGEGSAASSAAGDGAASSSAAGDGAASSSAAGEGAAASSATGDSTSSSSVGAGGEVDVEVSGGGEAAGYSEGQGVHISGSGEVTRIDERFCTCVPGYLCDEDGYINTSGAGQIDIRTFTKTAKKKAYVSKCTDQETCCKHRDNEQIGWTPSDCGDRSPIPLDRRIVGGEASGLGRYPWMVAIILTVPGDKDKYVCGGSLIRDNVVLTGAHCVAKLQGEHLKVRVGEWDTCNDDELYPHKDIDVTSILVHEEFNAATLFNDVALLTLSQTVEPAPHINTICLPDADHLYDVDLNDCVVTGWGKESFDDSRYSNFLKEVSLKTVGHDDCEKALRTTRLGQWFNLHDTFTCAGGLPGVDACVGDGGAPYICRIPSEFPEDQRFVQIGIVAWGIGCGQAGIPGVYADVRKLLPWIEGHLPSEYP